MLRGLSSCMNLSVSEYCHSLGARLTGLRQEWVLDDHFSHLLFSQQPSGNNKFNRFDQQQQIKEKKPYFNQKS